MGTRITTYGRDGCEPCKELEGLLKGARIRHRHVDICDMTERGRERFRRQLCEGARVARATVPAIAIRSDDASTIWISNHDGLVTPPVMIDALQAYIEAP